MFYKQADFKKGDHVFITKLPEDMQFDKKVCKIDIAICLGTEYIALLDKPRIDRFAIIPHHFNFREIPTVIYVNMMKYGPYVRRYGAQYPNVVIAKTYKELMDICREKRIMYLMNKYKFTGYVDDKNCIHLFDSKTNKSSIIPYEAFRLKCVAEDLKQFAEKHPIGENLKGFNEKFPIASDVFGSVGFINGNISNVNFSNNVLTIPEIKRLRYTTSEELFKKSLSLYDDARTRLSMKHDFETIMRVLKDVTFPECCSNKTETSQDINNSMCNNTIEEEDFKKYYDEMVDMLNDCKLFKELTSVFKELQEKHGPDKIDKLVDDFVKSNDGKTKGLSHEVDNESFIKSYHEWLNAFSKEMNSPADVKLTESSNKNDADETEKSSDKKDSTKTEGSRHDDIVNTLIYSYKYFGTYQRNEFYITDALKHYTNLEDSHNKISEEDVNLYIKFDQDKLRPLKSFINEIPKESLICQFLTGFYQRLTNNKLVERELSLFGAIIDVHARNSTHCQLSDLHRYLVIQYLGTIEVISSTNVNNKNHKYKAKSEEDGLIKMCLSNYTQEELDEINKIFDFEKEIKEIINSSKHTHGHVKAGEFVDCSLEYTVTPIESDHIDKIAKSYMQNIRLNRLKQKFPRSEIGVNTKSSADETSEEPFIKIDQDKQKPLVKFTNECSMKYCYTWRVFFPSFCNNLKNNKITKSDLDSFKSFIDAYTFIDEVELSQLSDIYDYLLNLYIEANNISSTNNDIKPNENKDSLGQTKGPKVVGKYPDYISWGEYFMGIAELSALRSKDPSTRVGCCIVNNNKIVSIGYNGLTAGMNDDEFNWNRDGEVTSNDTKYPFIVHSELNAILNCNNPSCLKGAIAYVTLFPCNECAKALIQAGISKIVYKENKYKDSESVKASVRMLKAANVSLFQQAGVQRFEIKIK